MPLTSCPDCRREVSTVAQSYPHYGRLGPFRISANALLGSKADAAGPSTEPEPMIPETERSSGNLILIGGDAMLALIIAALLFAKMAP